MEKEQEHHWKYCKIIPMEMEKTGCAVLWQQLFIS
jgi:hypothetical protein